MRTRLSVKTVMGVGILYLLVGLAGYASAELIGYWPLDEGEGTVATDVIGGNDGTITGSTWVLPGQMGDAALDFAGGDNVKCGVVTTDSDLTVAFWMKASSLAHCQPILASAGNYSMLPGWRAMLRLEGGVWFRIEGSDAGGWAGGDLHIADIVYEAGTWVHMIFTFDSETRELNGYVNGQLKGTTTVAEGRTIANSTQNLIFGTNGGYNGSLDEVAIWDNALTAEEVMDVYTYGANPFDFQEIPANRSTIVAGDVTQLEWTNMAPTTEGDDVFTEVWYAAPGETLTRVTDANDVSSANATTYGSIDTSALGTYTWRVNSYTNGAGTINEPNKIEGQLFTFTAVADPAPVIDSLTPDLMTWSGGPVPLAVEFTNEPDPEATIIEWTAEPVIGVTAEFDDNTIANPTITLTNVSYLKPYVTNGSFEDGHLSWTSGEAGSATFVPGDDTYDEGYGPVGESLMWVNGIGSITQTLVETLEVGATYELTVQVANNNSYEVSGYNVELMAGDNILAMDTASLNASNAGQFATSTVTYDYAPEDANKVGLPLTIRMGCTVPIAGNQGEINFDDVVLKINGESGKMVYDPEMSTVTVTVAVSDAANPTPVTASMAIDVYDTACLLARFGEGKDNPGDLDKDCEINIDDLRLQAATWLNDIALVGPAVSIDQSDPVSVPNGDFELLYKPGTMITGNVSVGGWTIGVGPDCPIESGVYEFFDGTTGNNADIAGWVGYDREGWIANGGTGTRDTTTGNFQGNVNNQANNTPDGSQSYGSNGGGWGNAAGGLIVSAASLGQVNSGTYTLSMMARGRNGIASPIVLNLLADGVVLTPTSSANPTLTQEWQEFSRTYDLSSIPGVLGQSLTVVLGVDRESTGEQSVFDDVTLDFVKASENLPTVDAGVNMVTWTDGPVTLDPTVTSNDGGQGTMTYLWTASPADGVVFSDPVNPADPNTSAAEAPTVTITKPTGDPTTVTLTLGVTLDGVGYVSNSMTIDVYDTACRAGMSNGSTIGYDLGDINEDCITNLEDFAKIAEAWLVDYKATGPVAKPEI